MEQPPPKLNVPLVVVLILAWAACMTVVIGVNLGIIDPQSIIGIIP